MEILTNLAKGFQPPATFFAQFGGHDELGTHREIGRYHVSMVDDHDVIAASQNDASLQGTPGQTSGPDRARCRHSADDAGHPLYLHGTEQAFDGGEHYHDPALEPLADNTVPYADRYVREAMSGGSFGAFGTSGCSFFDQNHPAYLRIAAIAKVVTQNTPNRPCPPPRPPIRPDQGIRPWLYASRRRRTGSLVAHRLPARILVAINTHGAEPHGAWVTIAADLHPDRQELTDPLPQRLERRQTAKIRPRTR